MKSPEEIKAMADAAPVDPASTTPAAPKPAPLEPPKHTTVGRLREPLIALLAMSDDTRVYFGDGHLSFNRIVDRGARDDAALMQVEFNEIYVVTPDPTGG